MTSTSKVNCKLYVNWKLGGIGAVKKNVVILEKIK